jgi:hypothetical protein
MSKHSTGVVFVKVLPNAASTPPGKLVDAAVVFEADSGPFNGLELIGFLSGDGVAAASLGGAVTAPTRTPGLRETSPATAASRRWDRRALPTWLASRRQPTLLPQ